MMYRCCVVLWSMCCAVLCCAVCNVFGIHCSRGQSDCVEGQGQSWKAGAKANLGKGWQNFRKLVGGAVAEGVGKWPSFLSESATGCSGWRNRSPGPGAPALFELSCWHITFFPTFRFRSLRITSWTSFWPCLRHGALASSHPLPTARPQLVGGVAPKPPFCTTTYHICSIASMVFTVVQYTFT